MLKRIILDILLFLSVLFAPWWVSVLLALIFMIYFRNFIEIIIAGFIIDILYGNGQMYFTVGSLVVFVFLHLFKRKIR